MRIALIFSLVLAILAVVFALQNPQVAEVNLFGGVVTGSTALILIVTFAIGVVVGVLAALPGWISNRRKVNRLRKQIAEHPGAAPSTSTSSTPAAAPSESPPPRHTEM